MVDMDCGLGQVVKKCKVFSSLEVWFRFIFPFFSSFFPFFLPPPPPPPPPVFFALFVRWVKSVLLIYSCAHTQSAGCLPLEANIAVCQETCIIKCAKFYFWISFIFITRLVLQLREQYYQISPSLKLLDYGVFLSSFKKKTFFVCIFCVNACFFCTFLQSLVQKFTFCKKEFAVFVYFVETFMQVLTFMVPSSELSHSARKGLQFLCILCKQLHAWYLLWSLVQSELSLSARRSLHHPAP